MGDGGEGAARQPRWMVGVEVKLTTSPSTASSQTRLTVTAAVWLAIEGAETGAGRAEERTGGDTTDQHLGDIDGPGQGTP